MYNKTILVLLLAIAPVGLGRHTVTLNNQPSDFGIYLLRDDTLRTWQAKLLPLNALDLAPKPLIGINDIESYEWSDHTIKLTKEGLARIRALQDNKTLTLPFPFVVVVGNIKIYMGNFFQLYSSYMPVDLPYMFPSLEATLTIRRAPDKSIKDQREDPRIYDALRRRNKLKL